ncbi:hypothetical protein DL546_007306 [Coniochaeta pulveracea]|uniref:Uncharacterized protein n=1 Tax=Coniochaeta pulveracea TaxID=177199 RepID=A0A420YMT2_9PEZI|nr:hypothetical protein DL546_007306 [Coniochaeta pulveracea]
MTSHTMPPTTRSRGKAPAAPASRVYHSSPTVEQIEFPARRRTVKSYGRQPQSAKLLRQSTLTQIGYIDAIPSQELELSPVKDDRPGKRRKTMGDAPNSSFHTQTLTQLISELDKDELDDIMLLLSDHEEENAPPQGNQESEGLSAKRRGKRKATVPKKTTSRVTDGRALSIIPQTPVHKKNKKDVYEIPSSQPTPTSPWYELPRNKISPHRSPLTERAVNTSAPRRTAGTALKRPRDMVIQDSYSSAGLLSSDPMSTPAKLSVPATAAASATRREISLELGESVSRRGPQAPSQPTPDVPMVKNRRVLGEIEIPSAPEREIPDSDEELDSLEPTPVKRDVGDADFTPARADSAAMVNSIHATPTISSEVEEYVLGDSDDDLVPGSPTPIARRVHANPQPSQRELEATKHAHLDAELPIKPVPIYVDDIAAVAPESPTPLARGLHANPQPSQTELDHPKHTHLDNELSPKPLPFHADDLVAAAPESPTPLARGVHANPQPSQTELEHPKHTHLDNELSPKPLPFHADDLVAAAPESPTPLARGVHANPQPSQTELKHPKHTHLGPDDELNPVSPQQASSTAQIPVLQANEAQPPRRRSPSPRLPQGGAEGRAFPASRPAPRGPPEVVEISDDSLSGSPQKSKHERTRDRAVANVPSSSTTKSSQEQVSNTPTSPRRVRIEVPEHSKDDSIYDDTPVTSPHHPSSSQAHGRPTPAKSQYYSQGLESQRVPLEVIRSMAPQTDRSDVIISIHPGPAEQIANGHKTHEFRNYNLPPQVSRIWIYITAPVSELRYLATVGPAQEPGQIPNNNAENEAFNAGRGLRYAHELLQVYQLNNPVSLAMIKERGFMKTPPQRYQYIPPAIVGELLGNLRCALFDSQHMELPHELPDDEHQEPERGSGEEITESQEIEEQLRSDIILATSQAQPAAAREDEDKDTTSSQSHPVSVVPTSPAAGLKAGDVFARPQVPASHLQRTPATQRFRRGVDYNTVRPSQATTASQPSSPVLSPEKSMTLHRPSLHSSGPSFPDFVGETQFSPLRHTQQPSFDLGSSQAIRLPDSLLVDDVRPPPVIWESEDEDDD